LDEQQASTEQRALDEQQASTEFLVQDDAKASTESAAATEQADVSKALQAAMRQPPCCTPRHTHTARRTRKSGCAGR
jgi:hypothetical protein